MAKVNLTAEEIQDLITNYNSSLKKLEFQMDQVKDIIKNLEKAKPSDAPQKPGRGRKVAAAPVAKAVAAEPKRRGRKPKAVAAVTSTEEVATPAPAKKKPGRKATAKAKPSTGARRGRKPAAAKVETATSTTEAPVKKPRATAGKKAKAAAPKGRPAKLSEWDQLAIDTIAAANRMLSSAEILDAFMAYRDAKGLADSNAKIKQRLNATLYKLSRKDDGLGQVDTPGRGFDYALKSWYTKAGKLPKKYQVSK